MRYRFYGMLSYRLGLYASPVPGAYSRFYVPCYYLLLAACARFKINKDVILNDREPLFIKKFHSTSKWKQYENKKSLNIIVCDA
jgi:hypothetical protein